MKKTVCALLACVMLASLLSGCGAAATTEKSGLCVVTTGFAPYDLARQILGERGSVVMLLPPGSEVHSFEPTPKDVITIENADLFIYVGGESDAWVLSLLDGLDAPVRSLTLIDCVELYEEEALPGLESGHDHEHEDEHDHEDDHEHEPGEIEYDEHVWTSPRNAALICEKIKGELAAIDPDGESYYAGRLADYTESLAALDTAFRSTVGDGRRDTLIFADRFPLRYFTEAYGLSYFAAFPGCAEETEPSAATVAFLIDKVNDEAIPVVFHIELSNEDMANVICAETGAKKLQWNACHNVTRAQFESGVTYLSLMWENVDALKEALA